MVEGQEFLEDEMTEQIDWDKFFVELPDFSSLFDEEPSVPSDLPPKEAFSNPSPDSASSWISEIESLLMMDDDHDDRHAPEPDQQLSSEFLDVLVDSPAAGSASGEAVVNGLIDKESDVSDESGNDSTGEKKVDGAEVNKDGDDADDPISKKRRRQLRNKDAALRSRERKKMYVRDLEMKSKYLEGECRRLGRVLQCFIAENQALRLSLQKGGSAFGDSSAKQESAVLLLESLLLGSLLWFLGIMCLFTLPKLPQSALEAIQLEMVEKRSPESVARRGGGSKMPIISVGESFVKSRRCKASRTRMKLNSHVLRACV